MSDHYFILIIFICLGMFFCGFILPSRIGLTDDFGGFFICIFTMLCIFAITLPRLPESSSMYEQEKPAQYSEVKEITKKDGISSQQDKMFCPECGEKHDEEAVFCEYCGYKFKAKEE